MTHDTPKEAWGTGHAYEQYVGRWSRQVARPFLAWLAGAAWLDVGCGALAQAILDEARPASVLGIDRSEGFIQAARQHRTDPRAQFMIGDATHLPLDTQYNVTVSGLVLNFVPDHAAMLQEMMRGHPPRRRGGRLRVGLRRRYADDAALPGRRRSGQPARPSTGSGRALSRMRTGRPSGPLAGGRAEGHGRHRHRPAHRFPGLRRLLAAVPGQTGGRAHLPGLTGRRRAGADSFAVAFPDGAGRRRQYSPERQSLGQLTPRRFSRTPRSGPGSRPGCFPRTPGW